MAKNDSNLDKQFKDLKEQYNKVPKRKKAFLIRSIIFVVLSTLLGAGLFGIRSSARIRTIKDYLNSNDYDMLMTIYDNDELRGNSVAYDCYQDKCLGIDNNIALAGISISEDINRDYLNEIANIKAYKNNQCKLEIYVDNNKVFESEDNVGELIATPLYIYYINESQNNYLYQLSIETLENKPLVEESIVRFALYGDHIFLLTKGEVLINYSIKENSFSNIANNIQRFFVSDSFIVQNEKTIFKISFNGRKKELLISNALLLGVDDEHVYYSNFGESSDGFIDIGNGENDEVDVKNNETEIKETVLYSYSFSTKEKQEIDRRDNIIHAVYLIDEGMVVDTVK